jgi:hypothetical protein
MKCKMTFLVLFLSAHVGTVGAQSAAQIEALETRINEQQRQFDIMRVEQQRQLDAMREELETLKKAAGITAVAGEQQSMAQISSDDVNPEPEHGRFVMRRSESAVLTLGGRLHRVLMQVDDGASRNGFFMDSGQGPTMLRADVRSRVNSEWTLAGALEVGIQSNPAFQVSQDNPNPGTNISVREADLEVQSDRFGKFSFGRGFAAAWVVPELDLSGTVPSALLANGNLAPGMKFVERTTDELSSITVSQHFADTERLLLVDRFRYDSPAFGGGFRLAGTIAADSRWDTALRFYPTVENWTIRAAATYQHKPYQDLDHRFELGASARHDASGLSLTAGWIHGEALDERDLEAYIIKAGWLAELNSLGPTAFSIDYSTGSDARLAGDEARSFGIFAQQKWEALGLDLYGGYRRYTVDRPDINLRPMDVLVFGGIYTF